MTGSCGKTAVVWGSEPPAYTVAYEEPLGDWDSGHSVLFSDAPDPEAVDDVSTHPGVNLICLNCLIDEHPELGGALDLARRHGLAELDAADEWVVGNLSRFDPE